MTVHRPDTNALLLWYDRHARALPWRSLPGAPPPDPYRVWLSEVMLQQTTVVAVSPRYEAWLARWPTVEALAAAADAEVMQQWAGLGYYARARNLLKAARDVVARGGFPRTAAGLRRLPGVGDYTAAAIASIAFNEQAAVIDGNVERVMARILALEAPLPAGRPAIRAALEPLVPTERPGDFAQATMDLGATICTPRAPACERCPWAEACTARALGRQTEFPRKAAKGSRPAKQGTAWWLEASGHVLLVRRPPRGLLGGMRALPAVFDGATPPPVDADWQPLQRTVAHGFTHFDLTLRIHAASLDERPPLDGEWWPVDALDSAGLPTLFAKCVAAVLAERAAPGLPLP